MFEFGNKYDAQYRYDDWNTTQVKLKLNNRTDADILAWVERQRGSRSSSIQGAIKALIREDIARSQPNAEGGTGIRQSPSPGAGTGKNSPV